METRLEGLRIRPARARDAERLRRLQLAAVRGLARETYSREELDGWIGHRSPAHYRDAMAAGELFLVAIRGRRLCGFASLKGGVVRAMYVHPDFARRGVGSALLEAVERIARERGHTRVKLTASLNGVPFYRANGYTGRRPVSQEIAGGRLLPAIAMQKRLDA